MTDHDPSTKKKLALVTGASRGIGAAIAEELARNGYDLVLTCSNSMGELKALADRLERERAVHCLAIRADMGQEPDVREVFAQIDELDVLVNNAGISYIGLLSEMSAEDWRQVMRVNLDSCFYTSKAAIPLMLRKHAGIILNISSVWGNIGASMEVAYSASKGGMNAFTKALAKELAPSNIRVNAIACGVIDTTMNSNLSEEEREALRAEIPADRFGTASEVAQLALQLIQAPGYLSGQVITLDGGWT